MLLNLLGDGEHVNFALGLGYRLRNRCVGFIRKWLHAQHDRAQQVGFWNANCMMALFLYEEELTFVQRQLFKSLPR